MNKKIFIGAVILLALLSGGDVNAVSQEPTINTSIGGIIFERVDNLTSDIYNSPPEPTVVINAEPAKPEYSEEDIALLALVTMAEAEGESEEGKRLVIDTILNRVDHWYFPDSISGVIYQSGQFTSMWNGRSSRCYVSDDILQLVREELDSRTNTDVIYFTAGGYGRYGTPLLQVGNHYFASY